MSATTHAAKLAEWGVEERECPGACDMDGMVAVNVPCPNLGYHDQRCACASTGVVGRRYVSCQTCAGESVVEYCIACDWPADRCLDAASDPDGNELPDGCFARLAGVTREESRVSQCVPQGATWLMDRRASERQTTGARR